jgi:hypothetical protein
MYKLNGVGCSPCQGGCVSLRGFGTDTVSHPDAAQDRALMEELLRKYTAITVVSVLAGMYFIEEYWGRH